jgi:hypothetical protein
MATERDLEPDWFDADDVGVPGAGALIPEAALQRCAARGLGISTARRAVCVYMRTAGTTPGARIDELAGEAQEIAALTEG